MAEPFIEMPAALKKSVDGRIFLVDGEKQPPDEDRLNEDPASSFLGPLG